MRQRSRAVNRGPTPRRFAGDPDHPATGQLVDAWLVALRAVGVPGPARQWCALRLGRVGARGWRAGGLGERWVLQAFLRFVRRSQA